MTVAFPKLWTEETFLDWVERQEEPYEFDGVGPVAMNGGTFRHSLIGQNIAFALRTRLHGTGLVVLSAGMGMRTSGHAIRFPDAFVTQVRPPDRVRTVDDVVAAFEVLSPSTQRTDRVIKPREYAAVPSLRQYVLVEQDFVGVTVFSRASADEGWSALPIGDMAESIALPAVGTDLPLAEVYEGVAFDDAGEDTEPAG